jgi:NADP-dependent aldehyde dehydrogenase
MTNPNTGRPAATAPDPAAVQGYDPRTGEPAGDPVPATPAAETARIAAAADAAAEAWRETSREDRAAALDAVAAALDAHAAELAALADTETALGLPRLTGEVARTTGQLRLFAGVLREGAYRGIVIEPGGEGRVDLRRINRPLGPVAVFAASNFPFAFSVAGGDTASALAAGCPVVVKAHEAHPRTSLRTAGLVAAALAASGAPEGVFAVVFGVPAGTALLAAPQIRAVGFTGSTRGGLALAQLCARRPTPIPFYGELGSVNPVFVLPGAARARAEQIAQGYAGSVTQGVGQFCTNPGLLFVPAGDDAAGQDGAGQDGAGQDAALLDAIAAAVRATAGGPMLSGRIHAAYQAAVADLAARPHVARLAEGKPGAGPWSATPVVFTVDYADFLADHAFLTEERFGPCGLVITGTPGTGLAADLRGGLGTALGGQLTASVHLDPADAADREAAAALAARLGAIAGRVVFDGWPTGVAVTGAQHHGGPYPATTAPAHTSVGSAAINRWLVPVVYQDCPTQLLPADLR